MRGVTFILGGARSGKSRYAEMLGARARKRIYIATAEIIDVEMRERIAIHRDRRGAGWTTHEAPLDLAGTLRQVDANGGFVLVDCITVWLGNLFHHRRDVGGEVDRVCKVLAEARGRVVVVANEVGLGIVPDNALSREFRDEAGRANQKMAEIADEVIFVAAGLPLWLKRPPLSPADKRRGASKRGRKA